MKKNLLLQPPSSERGERRVGGGASFPLFTSVASPASASACIASILHPPAQSQSHLSRLTLVLSSFPLFFLLLGICPKRGGQLPRERRTDRVGIEQEEEEQGVYLHSRAKVQIGGRRWNCGSAQIRISTCSQISVRKFYSRRLTAQCTTDKHAAELISVVLTKVSARFTATMHGR